MHILVGALVGAVFAIGMTVGMSLLTGKRPVWKHVALAALGGAIGGAVASATLGAGGFAAAGLGRQVVGMGLGGATGGASERVAENVVEDRPLHEGVARSTAVGAATGVVSLGMTRASGAAIARFVPRAAPAVTAAGHRGVFARIMAAPTPGTGRGFLRGLESRRETNERARVTADLDLPELDLPLGEDAADSDQATWSDQTPSSRGAPASQEDVGPARARAPARGVVGALGGAL